MIYVVFNDSNGNILSKNELRWHNDKRCYSMNEVNDAVKRHLDSEFEVGRRDPVVVARDQEPVEDPPGLERAARWYTHKRL